MCSVCLSAALLTSWASTSLTSSSFFPVKALNHVLLERVAVDGKNRCVWGLTQWLDIVVCGLVSIVGLGVVAAEVNWTDGTEVVRANNKLRDGRSKNITSSRQSTHTAQQPAENTKHKEDQRFVGGHV